ncbi:MAG: hypothetical protein K6T86_18125 [Pirellulales bacterium]|nr:hypothetical protein [Pirellulales bacterium]
MDCDRRHVRCLLVWCQAGSPLAVDQFLDRYWGAIASAAVGSLAAGMKRDRDKQDVWQSGLQRLMEHAETLCALGLGPALARYLCKTWRNLHTDEAKRSSLPAAPRQSIEECQPPPAPPRDDPLCSAILDEYLQTIRERAATHRGYRALEAALDGMDVKEIATLFGVTEKHLRRIMGTALRELFGGPSDE